MRADNATFGIKIQMLIFGLHHMCHYQKLLSRLSIFLLKRIIFYKVLIVIVCSPRHAVGIIFLIGAVLAKPLNMLLKPLGNNKQQRSSVFLKIIGKLK